MDLSGNKIPQLHYKWVSSLPEGYPQLHSQAQALHIGRDFAGVRFHMRMRAPAGSEMGDRASWHHGNKPMQVETMGFTMVFPMVEVETMGFTMVDG